jgi:hypothetical protein
VVGTSSRRIAVIAALSTLIPNGALPQQGGVVSTPGTQPTTPITAANPPVAPMGAPAARGGLPANSGGLQIDLNVSSDLRFDDNQSLSNNSAGDSTISDTKLSFGLSNITPRDTLSLQATTVLRIGSIPGRSIAGFEDQNLRFNYARDGVDSRFTADARYRHADREFLDPFQVEQEEQILGQLIGGGGNVTWLAGGVSLVTGINAPLGFQVSVRHDELSYDALAQSVDPLLFDRTTDRATGTVTARVSPVMQLRGTVGITQYYASDAVDTDRQTLDYSVGAVMDINPVLLLDAQIGYTDVTTDTITGRATQSGITGSARLTKTLTNGTIYGDLASTVNQNGTKTSLSFGRSLQLPNGIFDGMAGVTHTPGGSANFTGKLSYSHALRSSNITVTGASDVTTNALSQDVLNTRLSVAYSYAITSNSSFNLAANWGRSDGLGSGSGVNTTNRTTLTASYTHALTQDWNMTGGVQIRRREDNSGNAQSNSLFVTLDRGFSFRP